jgi:hypothetical protein
MPNGATPTEVEREKVEIEGESGRAATVGNLL